MTQQCCLHNFFGEIQVAEDYGIVRNTNYIHISTLTEESIRELSTLNPTSWHIKLEGVK